MRYIKPILIAATSFLLISCETVNPPQYQSQLHKLSQFNQAYYVYETKDWRPGGDHIYLQPVNWKSRPYAYKFPSLQDYLKNKREWREWHNTNLFNKFNGDEYRILGLVDKNTTYRLDKVVIGYENAHQDITIITGPLAGKSVIVHGSGWGNHGEMYGEAVKFDN